MEQLGSESRRRFEAASRATDMSALLLHPPLAVLANGFVSAFNQLRHCALRSGR